MGSEWRGEEGGEWIDGSEFFQLRLHLLCFITPPWGTPLHPQFE